MTPQAEEALRFLRLVERDQTAFEVLCESPHVDFVVAGFHAQQAVEKALKAVMCARNLQLRRTHDLEELAGQIADVSLPLPCAVDDLRRLTPYAVSLRYEIDMPVDLIEPSDARRIVRAVITWAQTALA